MKYFFGCVKAIMVCQIIQNIFRYIHVFNEYHNNKTSENIPNKHLFILQYLKNMFRPEGVGFHLFVGMGSL